MTTIHLSARNGASGGRPPQAPGGGEHRVVRGSSYKHGSISALRSAYRDYSSARVRTLGFVSVGMPTRSLRKNDILGEEGDF